MVWSFDKESKYMNGRARFFPFPLFSLDVCLTWMWRWLLRPSGQYRRNQQYRYHRQSSRHKLQRLHRSGSGRLSFTGVSQSSGAIEFISCEENVITTSGGTSNTYRWWQLVYAGYRKSGLGIRIPFRRKSDRVEHGKPINAVFSYYTTVLPEQYRIFSG